MRSRSARGWLASMEVRELAAARSYWLLLLVVGALVGHAFMTSTSLYAEASGIGGGPSALASGLRPLEGIVVPTFGAYDLAATLLFPFVAIRLVSSERATGSLLFTLQSPATLAASTTAKAIALLAAWIVALVPGFLALALWRGMGGHLSAPETWTVVLGYALRGALTIGIAAAAAAVSASAASAAIVALTITLGTWALEYVGAARGGFIGAAAQYTPSAALRVFEHGELRLSTVLVLLCLSAGGLVIATIWLDERRTVRARAGRTMATAVVLLLLCGAAGRLRASWDVSEDRRNSFPRADEAALRSIRDPLRVTVYLAAEDPRLVDLDRDVLAKLRRTMPTVDVEYAAEGRSGLFARPGDHYGEVWYELRGRREMTRSATPEIVLETIYRLAGRSAPNESADAAYTGYPLRARSSLAPWVFFGLWPLAVAAAWLLARRPRSTRVSP